MLRNALKKRDFSEDVEVLAKAATIIHDDIFNPQGFKFTGSFPLRCQEDSLPLSLKSLVSLIFNGPNLKDQDKHELQSCLTISQLLHYKSSDSAVKVRHTLLREPPLPNYIGLNMHQLTRSTSSCIGWEYALCTTGLWRLKSGLQLQLLNDSSKMELFHLLVFERKGLFTVGALDNLDHNPSATTSQSSFHGTGNQSLSITNESKNLVWPDSLSQYHHYLGADVTLCLTTTCKPLSQLYL